MTPHDLIAAFEAVSEAPDGATRLRELVLQLAVRGRLVPQDPADESASELLERVAADKARRVAAKLIKKPKKVPGIADDAVPFPLPPTWAWSRFVDVAKIASNLVNPADYLSEPHIAPNHIEKATGRLLPYQTVAEDGVKSAKHRFRAGQILYSKIRPKLSKVVTIDFDGLCSADMYPIDAWIKRGYLHAYMLSEPFLEQATDDDNRLAMPKVNQEQLSAVMVAVPPLAEQHRIVAKVEELMGLIDRLEAARDSREATRVALRDAALVALREADSADEVEVAWQRIAERMDDLFTDPADPEPLRQTVLQLAVRGRLVPQDPGDEATESLLERVASEKAALVAAKGMPKSKPVAAITDRECPFDLPAGWTWARMDTICTHIVDCLHSTPKYSEKGLPAIRTADVVPGRLLLSQARRVAPDVYEDRVRRLEPVSGDILYTREGERLGIAATIPAGVVCCLAQRMAHLRTSSLVLSDYVACYLNSPSGYGAARGAVNQTTSPHVNMGVDFILIMQRGGPLSTASPDSAQRRGRSGRTRRGLGPS